MRRRWATGPKCYAGPLVAAAVRLRPAGLNAETLAALARSNDSKKLSAKARRALAVVLSAAQSVAICLRSARAIDERTLDVCKLEANQCALALVAAPGAALLADGRRRRGYELEPIEFERHAGYGTKYHEGAIARLDLCDQHPAQSRNRPGSPPQANRMASAERSTDRHVLRRTTADARHPVGSDERPRPARRAGSGGTGSLIKRPRGPLQLDRRLTGNHDLKPIAGTRHGDERRT